MSTPSSPSLGKLTGRRVEPYPTNANARPSRSLAGRAIRALPGLELKRKRLVIHRMRPLSCLVRRLLMTTDCRSHQLYWSAADLGWPVGPSDVLRSVQSDTQLWRSRQDQV